jgi:hypothetical protein
MILYDSSYTKYINSFVNVQLTHETLNIPFLVCVMNILYNESMPALPSTPLILTMVSCSPCTVNYNILSSGTGFLCLPNVLFCTDHIKLISVIINTCVCVCISFTITYVYVYVLSQFIVSVIVGKSVFNKSLFN